MPLGSLNPLKQYAKIIPSLVQQLDHAQQLRSGQNSIASGTTVNSGIDKAVYEVLVPYRLCA